MSIIKGIVRRVRRQATFPWSGPCNSFADRLREATRRLLGREIRATKWTVHSGWCQACLAHGLACCPSVWQSPQDQEMLRRYADSLMDSGGTPCVEFARVDDWMIGYSVLDLWDQTSQARYGRFAEQGASFLIDTHVQTSGLLPYRVKRPGLMLVDTLGMVAPFLVRYGVAMDDSRAVQLGIRQLADFLQHGMDTALGLPFHAYEAGGAEHLGPSGWARGTGWLALGLVDSLAFLPADHGARKTLADAFVALAAAATGFQQKEGGWGWLIPLSHAPIDTSGTAMIGYALARGAELGLLDTSFHQAAQRALSGIARSTREDGVVDHAQGECLGVGLYDAAFGPNPAAQGFTLALAAQLGLNRKTAWHAVDDVKKAAAL